MPKANRNRNKRKHLRGAVKDIRLHESWCPAGATCNFPKSVLT